MCGVPENSNLCIFTNKKNDCLQKEWLGSHLQHNHNELFFILNILSAVKEMASIKTSLTVLLTWQDIKLYFCIEELCLLHFLSASGVANSNSSIEIMNAATV